METSSDDMAGSGSDLAAHGGSRGAGPKDEPAVGRDSITVDLMQICSESARVAPWAIDPVTRDAWWSDLFFEMLGYGRGGFADNSAAFRELIHPKDREDAVASMNALLAGEAQEYHAIFRLRCHDFSWRWFESTARMAFRPDGSPLICGGLKDVNTAREYELEREDLLAKARAARALAQKALAEAECARAAAKASEEMLRISVSSGDQTAWSVCDETGEAWMMDEGFRMMGYEPGDFVPDQDGWNGLIHPDDLPGAITGMAALLDGRTDAYRIENRYRHKDGSYHWYRGMARIIDRGDMGLPTLLAGTMFNTDQEKERELRLSEAVTAAEAARAEAQQSADILRVASENSGIVPWFRIQETDEFWFGPNIAEYLGLPKDTLVTLEGWIGRIHPEDLPAVAAAIEAVETGRTDTFDVKLRARRGDGEYFWCRSIGRRIGRRDHGLPDLICGAQFSIDELKQSEMRQAEAARALMVANERMTSIADNAPAGIYEYRRFPDGRIEFPYASARFCDQFGVTQEELMASPELPFARIHEEDLGLLLTSIERSEASMETWTCRFRAFHPTRGTRWFSGSSTPKKLDDGSVSWVGVLTDVTDDATREIALREAHQLAERMRIENERLALHDALTGLPNRRYFDQVFQARLDEADGGGAKDVCLIRVDLDKFKYINDTLGHEAGDLALKHVARAMQNCVRDGDFVARIGGDEFSIILSAGSDEAAAGRLVDQLRSRLEEPLSLGPRKFHVRGSFGVAYAEDILGYGRDLQFFADKALYTAKESGRNQVQFFTSDLHRGILDDSGLGVDLLEALISDQFVPYFQPQVSAQSGELVGIETLLRWEHPTRGLLTPDRFMPLAEQMRIMPEIDRLAYRKAIEHVRDWEFEGLVIPKVSFNISSGRMRDAAILQDTEQLHGALNAKITFELLESIVIENESDEFSANLARVRGQGIDIEIDDFGSGHASIISIMAISPSALKIDRRLIQPVGEDPKFLDVIRGIVGIANTLGVTTIAEGVETAEQARQLIDVGCGALQGYYFARPLSPDAFRTYLARDPAAAEWTREAVSARSAR